VQLVRGKLHGQESEAIAVSALTCASRASFLTTSRAALIAASMRHHSPPTAPMTVIRNTTFELKSVICLTLCYFITLRRPIDWRVTVSRDCHHRLE